MVYRSILERSVAFHFEEQLTICVQWNESTLCSITIVLAAVFEQRSVYLILPALCSTTTAPVTPLTICAYKSGKQRFNWPAVGYTGITQQLLIRWFAAERICLYTVWLVALLPDAMSKAFPKTCRILIWIWKIVWSDARGWGNVIRSEESWSNAIQLVAGGKLLAWCRLNGYPRLWEHRMKQLKNDNNSVLSHFDAGEHNKSFNWLVFTSLFLQGIFNYVRVFR